MRRWGKPAGSTSAGSRARFGERGEKGFTGAVPPPPQKQSSSGGGRRKWERHPAVNGGGSSAEAGRGIGGDLVVVPVRLEEGRSGLLPATSLPQLERALACSPGSRQLPLLTEEVAGAARWPYSEVLR
jgi:hypothetical protein